MLISVVENVGNFHTDARDGIVVLTCLRGLPLSHPHQRFPTTFNKEVAWSAHVFSYKPNNPTEPAGTCYEYEQTVYSASFSHRFPCCELQR